ncbi:hypothetical protein [Klebsiella grimontii]|uniref:hypothetical protein n=2 Tax=Klebsiella grimontii TaxID=2058152 RepID=UPI0011583D73|nr:hypothetical protein [Klebsiella grimontii]
MKLIKPNLNNISQLSIAFFIFLIVFLPSGSIGEVNVKVLSMLLMLGSVFLVLLSGRKLRSKSIFLLFSIIISFVFVLMNYMSASSISLSKGYAITEGGLFLTYFICTAVLFIVILEGLASRELVIKTIFNSCLLYSIVKIFITVLSFLGVVSINEVAQVIYSTYGIKPMLFPITDKLSRFQLANDYIVCFALFFIICKKESIDFITKRTLSFSYYILVISVLISFSRYMMLVMAIGLIIKVFSVRKISAKGILIASSSLFIFSMVYISNMDEINDAIALRFISDDNSVSDATRQLQINCLSNAFEQKPLLGHGGLGDYSPNCPGPRDAEFSYEVQYLGFLYRYGILQTLFLVMLYASQFLAAMDRPIFSKGNLPSLLAVAVWILIGFFNPYLVSGYASVIMVLCSCFTVIKQKEKN